MQHVITHCPRNLELRQLIRATVRLPRTASQAQGRVAWRARGPRPDGRYHQALPASMAKHFTAYVDGDEGGSSYPKVYWKFIEWDRERGKPHVAFDLNGGQMPKGARYS